MDKKADKVNVEQVLRSFERDPLSKKALENAQKRTWNQLSYTIKEQSQNNYRKQEKSLLKLPLGKKPLIAFLTVFLVTIVSIGTFAVLHVYQSQVDLAEPGLETAQLPQRDKIKEMAASRFEELTGISYEEYQVVAQEAYSNQLAIPGPVSGEITATPEPEPTTDPEKIKEINKKIAENQIKFYYIERTVTQTLRADFARYAAQSVEVKHPKVDYSRPYTTKTWYSPLAIKHLVLQDEEVISLNVQAPQFSYTYKGGEYGIKRNYEHPRVFGSLNTEGIALNPELILLAYIIEENEEIAQVGSYKEDGRSLIIYEDQNAVMNTIKTRYHIDLDNFEIYSIEDISGDKVLRKMKLSATRELHTIPLEDVINPQEVAHIPIKDIDITKKQSPKVEATLVSVSARIPVIHLQDENEEILIDTVDIDAEYFNEFQRLSRTRAYDPLVQKTIEAKPVLQYKNRDINVSVFAEKFYQDEGVVVAGNVEINSDKYPAFTIEVQGEKEVQEQTQEEVTATPEPEQEEGNLQDERKTADKLESIRKLYVEFKDWWYELRFTHEIAYASIEDMQFDEIGRQEAETIDTHNIAKEKAKPVLIELDVSNEVLELELPSEKDSIGSVLIPEKVESNHTCGEYYFNKFDYSCGMDCLLARHGGVKIQLDQVVPESEGEERAEVNIDAENQDIMESEALFILRAGNKGEHIATIKSLQEYYTKGSDTSELLYREYEDRKLILVFTGSRERNSVEEWLKKDVTANGMETLLDSIVDAQENE